MQNYVQTITGKMDIELQGQMINLDTEVEGGEGEFEFGPLLLLLLLHYLFPSFPLPSSTLLSRLLLGRRVETSRSSPTARRQKNEG